MQNSGLKSMLPKLTKC